MTFIQIMNRLAQMLRRSGTLLDVNSSELVPAMYYAAINDVKREIEAAHDWRVLDKAVVVTLVPGVVEYTLIGVNFNDRLSVQQVINTTSKGVLRNIPKKRLDLLRDTTSVLSGTPEFYCIKPPEFPNPHVPRVELYPSPNTAATVNFYVNAPQDDLTSNDEEPLVSSQLIILGAYARLYAERGEAVSTTPQLGNPLANYQRALADAIARDVELQGKNNDWFVCEGAS